MTEDTWLNSYVPVSPRLRLALDLTSRGGQVKRYTVVDNLAEQLDLEVETHSGYRLVANMVPELERVMEEGPGSWADDPISDRHGRVARAGVEGLELEELVGLIEELNLGRFHPPLRLDHVDKLHGQLASVVADWLAPRVLRMLDRWRKRGAWEAGMMLVPTRDARSA